MYNYLYFQHDCVSVFYPIQNDFPAILWNFLLSRVPYLIYAYVLHDKWRQVSVCRSYFTGQMKTSISMQVLFCRTNEDKYQYAGPILQTNISMQVLFCRKHEDKWSMQILFCRTSEDKWRMQVLSCRTHEDKYQYAGPILQDTWRQMKYAGPILQDTWRQMKYAGPILDLFKSDSRTQINVFFQNMQEEFFWEFFLHFRIIFSGFALFKVFHSLFRKCHHALE